MSLPIVLFAGVTLLATIRTQPVAAADPVAEIVCLFNSGPLVNELSLLRVSPPPAVGAPCSDGRGNSGTVQWAYARGSCADAAAVANTPLARSELSLRELSPP